MDRQMKRYDVPRVVFVNKLDRAGANPWRVIEMARDKLKVGDIFIYNLYLCLPLLPAEISLESASFLCCISYFAHELKLMRADHTSC